uniref:Gasdermin pore forming domain-containing protein n=1 Tax=Hucho hucho TaxID=62062 RepID=A0A4W5Q6C0_9TELE
MATFASATENFVKNIDVDDNLIAVSSLINSGKMTPLSLLVKKPWFFTTPKYRPSKFTLNDVFTGETPLDPVVKVSDFVDYSGTFVDCREASVDVGTQLAADAVDLNLNMGEEHDSTLESSFGKLKMEVVDVKWLHNNSKDKLLDMSHFLMKDVHKSGTVFGVVMERIVTSEPCLITKNVHQGVNFGAGVKVIGDPVSVKGKVRAHGVKDVFLEIPKNTVIAYTIDEIMVKPDGHFVLYQSATSMVEKVLNAWTKVGNIIHHIMPFPRSHGTSRSLAVSLQEERILHRELEKLSSHFQVLSSLPKAKRSSLLQLLQTTMEDREAVSVLENVLDQMLVDETPDMDDLMEENEKQTVQAVLDLLHESEGTNESQTDDESPSLLCSINLIVSAMNEMPDEGLSVLGCCCSPPVLQALQILVQHVAAGSGETLSLRDAGLAVLTEEEVFGRTESLFGHSKVTLKREEDTLRTEMKDQPGHLPLVMSITVKGLASLVSE